MKINRRFFLKATPLALGGLSGASFSDFFSQPADAPRKSLVISTWNFGMEANAAAWPILAKGGTALDAVTEGVQVPEGDPAISSVGYGGLPDRDGRVTLDACIMDEKGRAGGVMCLEHIKHPILVARKVMEDTPHVFLSGDGALAFALEKGFKKENLLTETAEKAWRDWLKNANYKPIINWENHDTIGMLALDKAGNVSGACTTSGMAFKMHGRVGDSPIIGAGLYVDNEVGAATCSGLGETVIRACGSFLVVELMRQGKSPQKACEIAIQRIMRQNPDHKDVQVGFIAVDKKGRIGACAIHKGFQYALCIDGVHRLHDAPYFEK